MENYEEMKVNVTDRDKLIDSKINDIQRYFIDRIIDGNYSVYGFTKNTIFIKVNDKYNFTIWIGSTSKFLETDKSFVLGKEEHRTFIHLNFSESEKKELHDRFLILYEKYYVDEKKRKLREELENLENNHKI